MKARNLARIGNVYPITSELRTNRVEPSLNLSRLGNAYSEANRLTRGFNVPTGNLLGLTEPRREVPPPALRANVANVLRPFDAAIFFDNEQHYVDLLATCGEKVTAVKVPGSYRIPSVFIGSPQGGADPVYSYLLSQLSPVGLATARAFQRAVLVFAKGNKLQQIETYDHGSGLHATHVEFLQDWVRQRQGQKLAALFDYDRTLTVMEGGYFLGDSLKESRLVFEKYGVPMREDELTYEGFAEYYAGGQKRLQMIQEMFEFLYANDVTVYILTNNSACVNRPTFFKEVISVFTRNRPFVLICGSRFQKNKKEALKSLDVLRPLCPTAGGRRKTRRGSHKRRQTKRHR